jgi:NADH-quinone oxidoreductase E subunit
MTLAFSDSAELRLQEILKRYPPDFQRAALLPTLYLAQEEFGHLSTEAMAYVAQRLGLPEAQVLAVATFYTMYNKRPVGRHHVQVCVSISCAIMGAHHLMHYLERRLGVRVGETSKDGRFTLSEVECLASCGTAPMMQINDDYYENLATEAEIDRVIGPLLAADTQRAE